MIICLTGMPGSGKTVVADMLTRKGFHVYEMSRILKDMMRDRGVKVTVKSLEDFAYKVRKEKGKDIVAVELAKKVRKHNYKNIVISGMRSVDEFRYIRRGFDGAVVVAIIAQRSIRYRRMRKRKKNSVKTRKEFDYREQNNIKRLGIRHVIRSADHKIYNNGNMRDLERKVDLLIEKLRA